MYEIGSWLFDPFANELSKDGEIRKLERRSAEVLALLVERSGEVVSKAELLSEIWKGNAVSEHSVAIVISDLRTVFNDDWRNPEFIETVPKRGYRLIAPVADLADPTFAEKPTARPHFPFAAFVQQTSYSKLLGATVVLMLTGAFALSMALDAAAGIGPDDGSCPLKIEDRAETEFLPISRPLQTEN